MSCVAASCIEHLASLESVGGDERLFVITPDGTQPEAIDEIDDARLTWFSFAASYDAIENALGDAAEMVTEHASDDTKQETGVPDARRSARVPGILSA